jgi:AAA ATPase domain
VAERRARALALEHAGALALVNELHKALVPPRGLIASGKFEQYKRDIPYATLAQAFRSLVRPILGESETQLVRWRKSLSEALGPKRPAYRQSCPRAGARDRETAVGGGPAAAGRQKSL